MGFDAVILLLFLLYAVFGLATGVVRRVIGLAAVYLALLVATYMGPQGGAIYQQYFTTATTPDARLYSFLFFLVLIVVVIEGMATAIHEHLQLSVVALNRLTGLLVGLVTALVLTVALFYVLGGYVSPLGSGALSENQVKVRDALNGSQVAAPLAKRTGPSMVQLLQAVLPRDAQTYFGSSAPR